MSKMKAIVFLRQLLIALSAQFAAFAAGGAVTYPTVLLQQLRSTESPIHLDVDTASWIGSIHGLTGLPSVLMPALMQRRGRRFAFLAACLVSAAGWVLAYTATSVTGILISESFHGLGTHSLLTVTMLSLSEMIAPSFRNITMVSYYSVQALGIASNGVAARLVHWKTISLIMGSSITIAFLLACFWPESPAWLAYKGQFAKCKETFFWLRGTDDTSTKELEELIASQKENKSVKSEKVQYFLQNISQRDFYVPCIFMFLLLDLMYWSGNIVIVIYGPDIILKATKNDALAAYGSIIINIIILFGITTTNILIKYFKNKSVLMFSTSGTAFFSLCICIVSYLQSVGTLPDDSNFVAYGLIGFMIFNSLGINSIVFTVAAEIMPVKYRGVGGALYTIFTCILHSSSLKAAPYLFLYVNIWGTFLIYTCNAVISGLLIWQYVPETKGRTLQEIENYYNKLTFEKQHLVCDATELIIVNK